MKILITSPSLNETQNVSGISSVVRQIFSRSTNELVHFELGKRDGQSTGFSWFLRQLISPIRFLFILMNEKPVLVHLNSTLTTKAIIRDAVHATIAQAVGIPVLLHLHGGRFLLEDFTSRFVSSATNRVLRSARLVLVLSDQERKRFAERWPTVTAEYLENAVEVETDLDLDAKVNNSIIFVGRLHESKGLDEIVKAVAVLNNEGIDFDFRCFGTGPEEQNFVNEMAGVLGNRFYFGGIADSIRVREELRKADIFVLPSRHGEGLPIALLEAMTAGCVVIASEMASIGTVISDSNNGFLMEPYNHQQLLDRLRQLLSGSLETDQLRENARKTVQERFNVETYAAKLDSIYKSLTNGQPNHTN